MKPSPYFDGAKAKNEAFLNNSFKLIKYREPTDSLCPFDVPPSECKEYEREWTIQSEHVVADGKPHLYTGFEIKTPHTCTADEQVRIAHALLNGDFKNATLSSLHVTKGVQKLVKGTDVRGLYVLLEKYDALHDEWVEQFRANAHPNRIRFAEKMSAKNPILFEILMSQLAAGNTTLQNLQDAFFSNDALAEEFGNRKFKLNGKTPVDAYNALSNAKQRLVYKYLALNVRRALYPAAATYEPFVEFRAIDVFGNTIRNADNEKYDEIDGKPRMKVLLDTIDALIDACADEAYGTSIGRTEPISIGLEKSHPLTSSEDDFDIVKAIVPGSSVGNGRFSCPVNHEFSTSFLRNIPLCILHSRAPVKQGTHRVLHVVDSYYDKYDDKYMTNHPTYISPSPTPAPSLTITPVPTSDEPTTYSPTIFEVDTECVDMDESACIEATYCEAIYYKKGKGKKAKEVFDMCVEYETPSPTSDEPTTYSPTIFEVDTDCVDMDESACIEATYCEAIYYKKGKGEESEGSL